MKTDIEVWEIDPEPRTATRLGVAEQVGTEEMLEDVLVANPDMLMDGLTLVARQVPVQTKFADLLGIDGDGRLVVFELKRGALTREAVAQVLDYGSYLEAMPDSELASLTVESSGKDGINKITDFDEWYGNRGGDSLKPVRMVLVGIGIDASASRMVAFLAGRGVDISLITFHGFSRRDGTLLARQVRYAEVSIKPPSSNEDLVWQKIREKGVENLWTDVNRLLDYSVRSYYTTSGITYQQRKITLPVDVGVCASHNLKVVGSGKLRITFYPAAIDLCLDKFERIRKKMPFKDEKSPNAPTTQRAQNQSYCLLDEKSWRNSKACLIEFVQAVENAWREHEYSETGSPEETA